MFDHYFSRFGKYAGRDDIESAADDATNPEKTGVDPDAGADGGTTLHARHRADAFCFKSTHHEWDDSHLQWDEGKNDGFFEDNAFDLFPGETATVVFRPRTSSTVAAVRAAVRAMSLVDSY